MKLGFKPKKDNTRLKFILGYNSIVLIEHFEILSLYADCARTRLNVDYTYGNRQV